MVICNIISLSISLKFLYLLVCRSWKKKPLVKSPFLMHYSQVWLSSYRSSQFICKRLYSVHGRLRLLCGHIYSRLLAHPKTSFRIVWQESSLIQQHHTSSSSRLVPEGAC